jgi:hypothetical protein
MDGWGDVGGSLVRQEVGDRAGDWAAVVVAMVHRES